MRQGFKPNSEAEIANILKGVCVWCGSKLEGRRKVYCSEKCNTDYWEDHSWGWIREKFFRESNKKCAKCDVALIPSAFGSNYVLDHIIPICMKGEEFELSNLQLLCVPCDKIKTREDMKKYREWKKSKGIKKLTDFSLLKIKER